MAKAKMIKTNFFLFTLLFALLLPISAFAQEDCLPKSSNRLVNDFTGTISGKQNQALEEELRKFNRETSNQMVVIITNELCNYEPMEYATNIGHSWGVGQKEFDNGIVLLVSPKHRKTFIAVGYGLEGAIPDAIAKRIVNQELLPNFRNDDYYGGITAATGVLMQLAKGEINAEDYGGSKGDNPALVLVIFILLAIVFFVVGPIASAAKYSSVNDVAFWTALMLIFSSRGSHSGMFGNFSSGSGGFGGGGFGSSGGGFGGFGGGGFGGGGAGGSW